MFKLDAIISNKSQVFLSIGGLPCDYFNVLSLHSHNLAISKHYSFKIKTKAAHPIKTTNLTKQKAYLSFSWGAEYKYLHGIISRVKYLGPTLDGKIFAYDFILESPLFALWNNSKPRVFINKNVIDIIKSILGEFDVKFNINSNTSFSAKDFTVQINETDLAFLERIMSFYGLFYLFIQQKSNATLFITDDINKLPAFVDETLQFQDQSGAIRPQESIYQIEQRMQLLTDSVKIKNYNYNTPTVNLELNSHNKSDLPGSGIEYIYGHDYADIDAGNALLKIKQQALDCKRQTFIALSDCRGLALGDKFSLTQHPISSFNEQYRIIGMDIQADQAAGLKAGIDDGFQPDHSYQAKLLLIKASAPFRTPIISHPKIEHIIPAKIEANGNYAFLDEQGRYRLRLPFDLADTQHTLASIPVRALQPYGGPINNNAYGWHFPLLDGTQVALSFIDSDINRPFIAGVIASPMHPATVNANNFSANTIRTSAANELTMDDLNNNEYILLATKDHLNKIKLDATSKQHLVSVVTECGDSYQYAHKSWNVASGDCYHLLSGNDHFVVVQNAQKITTKQQSFSMQAGRDILFRAINGNILQQAENGIFSMRAQQNINLECNNMAIKIHNNDLQLQTVVGKVNINTNRDCSIQGCANADMLIGQGDLGIVVTKSGDLSLNGPSITLEAPSINIHGLDRVNSGAAITHAAASTSPDAVKLEINFQNDHEPKKPVTSIDDTDYQLTINYDKKTGKIKKDQLVQDNIEINQSIELETSQDIIAIDNNKQVPSAFSAIPKLSKKPKKHQATVLFPPIIINLRDDSSGPETLTEEQIKYFKYRANNAVIFIHGFNVEFGEFAKQFTDCQVLELPGIGADGKLANIPNLIPKESKYAATTYRDYKLLTHRSPQTSSLIGSSISEAQDKVLNGTEAHNWFVHMENNLNLATGAFDHSDYSKFQRIINVAWSGDKFGDNLLNSFYYLANEQGATNAGNKLVNLIKQLHKHKITINIIAHSLGNRVLLTAMNDLGANNQDDIIDHVFLWEAAVPNTALSNNPAMDKTYKGNGKFINAYKATKKITVLYSNQDQVLGLAYWIANYIGISPSNLLTTQGLDVVKQHLQRKNHCVAEKLWELYNAAEFAAMLTSGAASSIDNSFAEKLRKLQAMLENDFDRKNVVQPALGFAGPDNATITFLKSKLILAPQSQWLTGHSEMKIPSPAVMKNVYQRYIVNKKQGINQFGDYSY